MVLARTLMYLVEILECLLKHDASKKNSLKNYDSEGFLGLKVCSKLEVTAAKLEDSL